MGALDQLYGHSLALLTDLYQLTMAQGYWKTEARDKEAVFQLYFRECPFGGGFAIACGLPGAADYLASLRFTSEDLGFLAGLEGSDDRPLFDPAFLEHLGELRFTCDVDAVPEGTVVFANEPLLRVEGPLLEAQIVETALLTLVNFPTLVATKAARVVGAARGEPVLELGLRRAQGIDGGVSASRAAYVGGAAATSNVLAGKLFGIPVRGTHAHSWVMSFDDELEAFRAYAEAMPNNCVFLVDTYDTIEGVRHAAEVGLWLRDRGHKMLGIRLDSGDLAALSKEARAVLDSAGLEDAAILASNDLDEHAIASLKASGATIAVWGVGTRLATAYDQPALGGVYKMSALRGRPGDPFRPRIKLSDAPGKTSIPGRLQVRRLRARDGRPVGDAIYDVDLGVSSPLAVVDAASGAPWDTLPAEVATEDLLAPLFRRGRRVAPEEPTRESRERARRELAGLDEAVRRLEGPARYPVGLEASLWRMRSDLARQGRAGAADGEPSRGERR